MKRDLDLMRKILFYIEENYDIKSKMVRHFDIDKLDKRIILEHIILLEEKGLVRKIDRSRSTYGSGNLTDVGYDFLELIRNENVWERANAEVVEKKLPKTIETIGTIAGSIVGAFMREYTK